MTSSIKDKFKLGDFYSKKVLSKIINEPNLRLVREGLYYCKNSNSILMINSDSTFNFQTMLHGGFSRAGTLQILKDDKVELKTTQIYSPKKSYQLPPKQIISIISNKKIKRLL